MIDVVGIGSRVSRRAGRDAGRRKGAADGVFPSSPSSSASSSTGHVAIAAPIALLAGACAAGVAAAPGYAAFGLDAWHPLAGLPLCVLGARSFSLHYGLCQNRRRRRKEERSWAAARNQMLKAGGVFWREGVEASARCFAESCRGGKKEAGRDEKGGE